MKCPKCDYLGFETADRCRNCGYDFSLTVAPEPPMPDLLLRAPEPPGVELPPLPLFARTTGADDEPLIKLPASPRAPLAVRRTPEQPRPRTFARPPRRSEPELALEFTPEEPDDVAPVRSPARVVHERTPAADGREESPVVRRVCAALVDLAILFAIDLTVVYFTLRMAGLTAGEWRMLPAVPMLAFLGIVKLAYFCAFTSIGGQTIGKMAARIQVVADDETPLDAARAARRVLAGALSTLAFGLGFIPALIGPDRRALHDRVARTRVVARPS
jgi:uncharacterized RDD family membrane protein YckC